MRTLGRFPTPGPSLGSVRSLVPVLPQSFRLRRGEDDRTNLFNSTIIIRLYVPRLISINDKGTLHWRGAQMVLVPTVGEGTEHG